MKNSKKRIIILIVIFIILIFGIGYFSGYLALIIKPTATIDSVTKGSFLPGSGIVLHFDISVKSIIPFRMVSSYHLSCTFGALLLNSTNWEINDKIMYNCPPITDNVYQPGTYKLSFDEFLIPKNNNWTLFPSVLEFLLISGDNPNSFITSPFYANF